MYALMKQIWSRMLLCKPKVGLPSWAYTQVNTGFVTLPTLLLCMITWYGFPGGGRTGGRVYPNYALPHTR